jgi:KipI family sensor histidine kinase inhibitor
MAVRFVPASDGSLLVSFGEAISMDTHRLVAALVRDLATVPVPGVWNIHPAYCSILIVFDPLTAGHEGIRAAVSERLRRLEHTPQPEPRTIELPVCYGGEYGPDLEALAAERGLAPERVVSLHSDAHYIAYFIGFVPGFAYLGGLPAELAAPRLKTPRPKVPRGSVGIAGAQTGVYPFETPGGWRLVGRTPVPMFQAGRDPMSRIALGDHVRFVPIAQREYRELAR